MAQAHCRETSTHSDPPTGQLILAQVQSFQARRERQVGWDAAMQWVVIQNKLLQRLRCCNPGPLLFKRLVELVAGEAQGMQARRGAPGWADGAQRAAREPQLLQTVREGSRQRAVEVGEAQLQVL